MYFVKPVRKSDTTILIILYTVKLPMQNTMKFDGCRIVIIFIVFVIISNQFPEPIQDNSLQINK